ncbi:hypothetical protein [Devosia sp.]|uniref:hypothetical protein n=1 Tax=Devosia sp. TaxID=1871048 RepID=UPI002AFE593D|nr:hypothetical protein [Devosia sp.]
MKPFSPQLLDDLAAGRVEYRDAVELVLDSGVVRMVIGVRGQFGWSDVDGYLPEPETGDAIFYGGGALVSLDLPESALGPESRAIVVRVLETYLEEGSDIPANVFDDGVRATIDEEPWQGRLAIASVFWIGSTGLPIYREQVAIRELDSMPLEWDADGNPVRVLMLEEPDITQRDIEGKTANGAFQALIDPADRAFEHVGTTVRQMQNVNWGRIEGSA